MYHRCAETYPAYLKEDVGSDGALDVYANGEIVYRVGGVHARVSVEWRFETPEGAGDTHDSIMRGSKARLSVHQGEAEGYRPTLYVEPVEASGRAATEEALRRALTDSSREYPGLGLEETPSGWAVVVPEKYRVGHEAHFARVTEKYFGYLVDGRVPPDEARNVLTRYAITTRAWEMSRP